jgi:hypothetical protein
MQPDIEIYLKKTPLADILAWLGGFFDVGDQQSRGDGIEISLHYQGKSLTCVVIERVVKGGYTSVWFRTNHTPWDSDEACARDAFEHFGAEVRCSIGGWTEEADDAGGWYRFTDEGRSVVNWLA